MYYAKSKNVFKKNWNFVKAQNHIFSNYFFDRKLKRDSIANLDQAMETEQLLQEKEAEVLINNKRLIIWGSFCIILDYGVLHSFLYASQRQDEVWYTIVVLTPWM